MRERAIFGEHSVSQATSIVLQEINRLNDRPWDFDDDSRIISTNLRLNKSMLPSSEAKAPADPGVAVYFTLRFRANGKPFERPCVLTCDKWATVPHNLWAIGKDIEAQRGRARWGCGTVQQAFQGYLAIPERCGARPWWEILKIKPDADAIQVRWARDFLARTAHPDKGGTHDRWVEIQNAFEQGMARFR